MQNLPTSTLNLRGILAKIYLHIPQPWLDIKFLKKITKINTGRVTFRWTGIQNTIMLYWSKCTPPHWFSLQFCWLRAVLYMVVCNAIFFWTILYLCNFSSLCVASWFGGMCEKERRTIVLLCFSMQIIIFFFSSTYLSQILEFSKIKSSTTFPQLSILEF